MRRLRPISRRRREREEERLPDEGFELAAGDDLRPFVPVESAALADEYAEPAEPFEEAVERLPRPEAPARRAPRLGVNLGVLLAVALLIAAGVIGTLLNLDRIELSLPEEWPAGALLLAVLWLVVALSRRQVTSALGAAALAGIGISALLDTQGIAAWRDTLLGAVLVTLGLGIVIRGLLLRQRLTA